MFLEQIEAKLKAAFDPVYLEVMNESDQHNVPAGAESHFKVVMASERFSGERILARHRAIYSVLSEELAGPVHALALHAYTLDEWSNLHNSVPVSPPCRGTKLIV
ncbi:transcriptional regulator BolA [Acerihabitans sp. TG2]|uniref:transcriptional regulator BolA n=1 Tax=Acerihabitans sp. TG2 TaxID=3096008 RepID=UPI002B235967|nr:transcriptional regulator BolA [Acerihabitans sp. TG2]MEA9390800.1 transcriptional regulator BolA [Acerihabitans sp. TG2]